MDLNNEILIGIDMADDFTQICYSSGRDQNSVSLSKDPLKYKIPTALCAIKDHAEWFFGEEAVLKADDEDSFFVGALTQLASKNGGIEIFGRFYPPDILLERFFGKLLGRLKEKTGASRIAGIVITLRRVNPLLRSNIIAAMELLGYGEGKVRVITYLESFMHYIVSQNNDIWINDVGLFDFDTEEVIFYKLSFNRKSKPVSVVADKTVLTDTISYSLFSDNDSEKLLNAFENAAELVLHKQIISALYFTGPGFESSWADDNLKKLCNGRRIFRGQNLYVKGAGCAAGLYYGPEHETGAEEYRFVTDDVLRSSLCIRVYKDGGYEELPIAAVGDRFEDVDSEIEVIMDRTNELDFIVHNVLKKDFICAIMTLETLRLREDRTTRLDIKVRFPERDICVITVWDAGFGEIYASDHKIWEQVLKI